MVVCRIFKNRYIFFLKILRDVLGRKSSLSIVIKLSQCLIFFYRRKINGAEIFTKGQTLDVNKK